MPSRPKRNLPSIDYSDFPVSLNIIDDDDSSDAFQSSTRKIKTKDKKKIKISSQKSPEINIKTIKEFSDSDEEIIIDSGPSSPKKITPLDNNKLKESLSEPFQNKNLVNDSFKDEPYTSDLTDVDELPSPKLKPHISAFEKKTSSPTLSSELLDEVKLLKMNHKPQKQQKNLAVEKLSLNSSSLTKINNVIVSSEKNHSLRNSHRDYVTATNATNTSNTPSQEIPLITQDLKDTLSLDLSEGIENKRTNSKSLDFRENSPTYERPFSDSSTKISPVHRNSSRHRPPVRKPHNHLPGKTLAEILGGKNRNRPLPCSGLFYSSKAPPLHPPPKNPNGKNN